MITIQVQRRGRGAFSIGWRDQNGEKHEEFLRGIGPEEAWKRAGMKEYELNHSVGMVTPDITWSDFRIRFTKIKLSALKPKSIRSYNTAFNAIEQTLQPEFLRDITTASIGLFCVQYPSARESIRSYLRHLQSAMNWAKRMQLVESVPNFEYPRSTQKPKGRPITEPEFKKMVAVIPQVRPHDAKTWERFLWGIWYSGLRISEARTIEWNSNVSPISINTSEKNYLLNYREHKSSKQVILPVLPDFQMWLDSEFPKESREGSVFHIPLSLSRTMRVVSAIGEVAGIVVSLTSHKGGGIKFASAHDLRRSFAARWAEVLPESILAAIMRHRSPETTRKHYAIMDAERILHAVEEATRRRGEQ